MFEAEEDCVSMSGWAFEELCDRAKLSCRFCGQKPRDGEELEFLLVEDMCLICDRDQRRLMAQ